MGDMTTHFSRREFTCKCGCNGNNISGELVKKLEQVYTELEKTVDGVAAIYITSGYRCPTHSRNVGGYMNDAHTKGIAADLYAVKADGEHRVSSYAIAAIAEKLGFSGIGIIDGTSVHLDIRNNTNYVNSHWFGDESTGNDNIKTFAQYMPAYKNNAQSTNKHKLTVTLDGKTILEKEF